MDSLCSCNKQVTTSDDLVTYAWLARAPTVGCHHTAAATVSCWGIASHVVLLPLHCWGLQGYQLPGTWPLCWPTGVSYKQRKGWRLSGKTCPRVVPKVIRLSWGVQPQRKVWVAKGPHMGEIYQFSLCASFVMKFGVHKEVSTNKLFAIKLYAKIYSPIIYTSRISNLLENDFKKKKKNLSYLCIWYIN